MACQQQGVDVSDLKTHNALDDCRATQRLYKKLQGAFDAYWKPFVKPRSTMYEEFKENIEEISQLFSQGLSISHIHQKLSQDGKINLSYTHFTKFFKDYTETYVSLAELPPPRLTDSKGRAITPFFPKTGIVPSAQFVVIGDTKYSLDSRYLGFVPQSSIVDTITPLFVF